MEKFPWLVTYISIYCSNSSHFFRFYSHFVSGSTFCSIYIIVASVLKTTIIIVATIVIIEEPSK